jgi:hypothetical protein
MPKTPLRTRRPSSPGQVGSSRTRPRWSGRPGRFQAEKLLSDEDMKTGLWTNSRLGAYGQGPNKAAAELGLIQ